MSYEQLVEGGLIIAGTPDQVADRLRQFYEQCGCANILMMMHAGPMAEDRVRASIRRFAEDVMPRLAHLGAAE
jgi:alkanesulfonate monooxygenase SsuD/methylene tetrahydromethanopterin reductase-like flavin-dependent oxidoreductase (luciferase family)